MDLVLTRLHRSLAEALRRKGAASADRPVTVAEIYQDLVPYRNVREAIGVTATAEYEHALVRLLSGEHGLLRLEPAAARDELRKELATDNPNLGIYRRFAACDVWVNLEAVAPELPEESAVATNGAAPVAWKPAGSAGSTAATLVESEADRAPSLAEEIAAGTGERKVAGAEAVAAADAVIAAAPPGAAASPSAGERLASTEARTQTAAGACAFCRQPLPEGREVRFCPHCGQDQRLRPCAKCGEVLERSWRFCIKCGAEAA